MPLFVCEKCNCIENTACGHYATKDWDDLFEDNTWLGKGLCSECTPIKFKDGSLTEYQGKWHGKFTKTLWDGKVKVLNRCEVCKKPIDNLDPCSSLCEEHRK